MDFLLEQPDFIPQFFIVPSNAINLSDVQKNNGSYNHKALIFVLKEMEKAQDYSFLGRILQAVELDLHTDCDIVEYEKNALLSFQQHYDMQPVVLFFGVAPSEAGLQTEWKKYKPYKLGKSLFLYIDGLKQIETDPRLKQELWKCLKTIFNK